MDGSGSDFRTSTLRGSTSDIEIRFLSGAIDLVANGAPPDAAARALQARYLLPASYVAELDLIFQPGSDVNFLWIIQGAPRSPQSDVRLSLNSTSEHANVAYWGGPAGGAPESLADYTIPGLASGRTLTIAAAVSQPTHEIYVDGVRLGQFTEARAISGLSILEMQGPRGTVRITGFRIYALP